MAALSREDWTKWEHFPGKIGQKWDHFPGRVGKIVSTFQGILGKNGSTFQGRLGKNGSTFQGRLGKTGALSREYWAKPGALSIGQKREHFPGRVGQNERIPDCYAMVREVVDMFVFHWIVPCDWS